MNDATSIILNGLLVAMLFTTCMLLLSLGVPGAAGYTLGISSSILFAITAACLVSYLVINTAHAAPHVPPGRTPLAFSTR